MQKFDVWVYFADPESIEPVDQFVDTFEGYLSEITAAVLTLYPQAIGILIQPETRD